MKVKEVPSTWLEKNGRRLDCGPYLSGAIEARVLLEELGAKKEPLRNVTLGGIDGLINPGRISRTWVDSLEYGMPFLTSTSILQADLSNVSLISRKAVHKNPKLIVREGWTLITRSGSIGRMAYCRSDMSEMACTEDVLRVVPNTDKILPGYLYAYLSSKFGFPLIISGTYGAIIQHLEPHHIADLPVPRLGKDVEMRAHSLIVRAAALRAKANLLLGQQKNALENEIAGGSVKWTYSREHSFATGRVNLSDSNRRLDAFHYVGYVGEALKHADRPFIEMKEVADALRPPIMKRIWAEEGGHEFLGGTELYQLDQRSKERVSTKTKNIDSYLVKDGQVLFQCVGQRYGLFGRPVLANRLLLGKAVTEAVMRILPHDHRDAGYISVYLATAFGRRLSMQHSAGTSIPVLQEEGARKIKIYWPDETKRHAISGIAAAAWAYRADATQLEDEARATVEGTIEGMVRL